MSDIKYGLISETDARILEKTIDLILNEFPEIREAAKSSPIPSNPICITEIGLFDCGTATGLFSYLSTKCSIQYTGIDNEKDKPIIPPNWMNLIIGNSNEVYNQLEDNSQHLIFFDGDHSKIGLISDFFAYADKIKVCGYAAFHDTGKHIKQFKDFQHGDKENSDAYISVRKALQTIGLLEPFINSNYKNVEGGIYDQWELVFDEADIENPAGGICVFKKLY